MFRLELLESSNLTIDHQSPATFSVATIFLSHTVCNYHIYMTIIPNDYFGTFFMAIVV